MIYKPAIDSIELNADTYTQKQKRGDKKRYPHLPSYYNEKIHNIPYIPEIGVFVQ